jgi:lipoyl(octanoyl) transferase
VEERRLRIHRLGSVPYARALALQEQLVAARIAGEIDDTLLLLEHPPVITLGRAAQPEHVLLETERLAQMGIEVHETGRGGEVTYHGPGQLVGYPIVNLAPDRCDVRRYMESLEAILIRIAAHFGVHAQQVPELHGAWVQDRKVGAVGVRIRQWVTMHGFALNVSTDLDAYRLIVPCGITDKGVTSLTRETGKPIEMTDVLEVAANAAAEVFGAEPRMTEGWPEVQ